MIKGWYAKHKDTGKWHKITDVKDTGIPADQEGGGNNYHLEGVGPVHQSKIVDMTDKPEIKKSDKLPGGKADGKKPSDFDSKQLAMGIRHEMEHTNSKAVAREIAMDHLAEDPEYYTKLKDMDKYDRVDVEADGKKELDYGIEELDKLKDRWGKLKKAVVDSDAAIMEIAGQEYNPDEEEDEQEPGQDEEMEESGSGDGGELPPDEEGAEGESEDEQDLSSIDRIDPSEQDEGEGGGLEELIQMLQEQGHSDTEIAHIVHGHNLPTPNIDDTKMEGEQAKIQQDLEHKSRMNDLAFETAQQEQGINELDKDHKQRMLDLEYETAKEEKAMELEFKRKELEAKLNHTNEKNKKALEANKVDANKSRSQDAAKTSKKEKEGK